jgi:hypothetical protein
MIPKSVTKVENLTATMQIIMRFKHFLGVIEPFLVPAGLRRLVASTGARRGPQRYLALVLVGVRSVEASARGSLQGELEKIINP